MTVDVSVVFPCLNERESVAGCVRETIEAFDAAGMRCEVVVADNGSTDGSADIAREAGARVVTEPRRGYGAAVTSGISASTGRCILVADADGTYPMSDGPALVRRADDSGAIVLGSRFAGRIEPGAMPLLHRLVGSPATRILMRVLLGIRSSDPHSGMRAMRRETFDRVAPRSAGWEFTVEMLANAKRTGIVVEEVPIDYRRRGGTSKLRAIPQGWEFLRFLVLHSPNFLFVVPGAMAMLVGLGLLGWLVADDRVVGPLTLGINSLVVGALATILGYQVLLMGIAARRFMAEGSAFSLERGITVGALLLLAGLVCVGVVAGRWWAVDFAPLPRSDHGIVIAGLTAAVIGMQTIFSSFFASLLDGSRR